MEQQPFQPHLSINKHFLPQTENLCRGDVDRGAVGAQREAAQRDSGFWRSFHSQTQEVQERSPCMHLSHFNQVEAFISSIWSS